MKKNILTVIILSLCIMNVILSAMVVFVVIPTAKKTNSLVDKVVSAIDLELESPEAVKPEISVEQRDPHEVAKTMTVNLKKESSETKNSYAVFPLSIFLDKTSKDYKKKGEAIKQEANSSLIKEIVTNIFSKYTKTEVKARKEQIKEEVISQLQAEFDTDCIIAVSFGDIVYQ